MAPGVFHVGQAVLGVENVLFLGEAQHGRRGVHRFLFCFRGGNQRGFRIEDKLQPNRIARAFDGLLPVLRRAGQVSGLQGERFPHAIHRDCCRNGQAGAASDGRITNFPCVVGRIETAQGSIRHGAQRAPDEQRSRGLPVLRQLCALVLDLERGGGDGNEFRALHG